MFGALIAGSGGWVERQDEVLGHGVGCRAIGAEEVGRAGLVVVGARPVVEDRSGATCPSDPSSTGESAAGRSGRAASGDAGGITGGIWMPQLRASSRAVQQCGQPAVPAVMSRVAIRRG